MTYESASEAEVLKQFWRADAPLENTVFAILDPYGRPLTHPGRDPRMFFRDAYDMASAMNEVASRYQSHADLQALPLVPTTRLALNVAACDNVPLVAAVSNNSAQRATMQQSLAPLAWSPDFIGQFIYSSGTESDLSQIPGRSKRTGYAIIAPDEFGTTGRVIAELDENASTDQLQNAMRSALHRYEPRFVDHHEHVRYGHMNGIHWQTAIPVTDPHAVQAEQMGRRGPPGGNY